MQAESRPGRAAIAAGNEQTAAVGERLALEGGNAVDIAVGATLAATLCEMLMCSLGGSGFLMLRLESGACELIEGADAMPGKGRAAAAAPPTQREAHLPYGDGITVRVGHGTVAVPGLLAALCCAHRRHGRLPFQEVMAPALELARDGWRCAPIMSRWLEMTGSHIFDRQPASRRCLLPDGRTPRPGELFRVPGLEGTYEAIAREGARAFYEGDLAASFVREMELHGGLVTRRDLASYEAAVRAPLRLPSAGFTLALNPPPAVGGSAVGALIGLLEVGGGAPAQGAARAELHARAQAYVLGLRERELAREDFGEHAARALLSSQVLARHSAALRSEHTTHLSVATADGSSVAVSMSMGYGAGVTIPDTGVPCNNSAGEPELNPRGFGAAPAGARLISNMAPTVAWHADGRSLALGSPGASRITTAIAQTWARYALEGCSMEEAVAAPRLHVEQWEDGPRAQCEPGIDSARLHAAFRVRPFEQPDMFFGGVQLVGHEPDGTLHAVADPRRDGDARIVD
ncbi:MAG: gamma-glutamyltransferase [Myxococcales bacterium]|nr:gamma-glutamyltransferase [Myxococcales bacterium]